MSKRKLEAWFTGFVALVFAFYLYHGLQMPLGSFTEPGSGFVPVVVGVTGFIISLFLTVRGVWSKATEQIAVFTRSEALRIVGYLSVLIFFVLTFKSLGLVLIFLTVLALSKISGLPGWIRPAVLAAGVTAGAYILFYKLLAVPLPIGIFG